MEQPSEEFSGFRLPTKRCDTAGTLPAQRGSRQRRHSDRVAAARADTHLAPCRPHKAGEAGVTAPVKVSTQLRASPLSQSPQNRQQERQA